MATWFDLPTEVKQLICEYVTDAESIIYIPKDRRYKIDHLYEAAHHFHDILLVAKNFITPEELSYAILRKAVVTFYSSNQLRRLVNEVNPAFKACIRRIELSRIFHPSSDPASAMDSFDSLTNIPKILSAMPDLRQIHISWDDYCAPLGSFDTPRGSFPTLDEYSEMLTCGLRRRRAEDVPFFYLPESYVDVLPNTVASFIGDRRTGSTPRFSAGYESSLAWTRPHGWIRRLIQQTEETNIEIIFHITLCISTCYFVHADHPAPRPPSQGRIRNASHDRCWCNRSHPQRFFTHARPDDTYLEMHTPAQMSTKDWILRARDHEGKEYTFYQATAYQMLHAKPRASAEWYENLLNELRYDGRHGPRFRPKFAF